MSTKEQQEIKKFTGINQDLFDHMANCHDLILVQSEMEQIKEICNKQLQLYKEYLTHKKGCLRYSKKWKCTCGFEQLLKDAPYKKEDNDTMENVWVLKKDAK